MLRKSEDFVSLSCAQTRQHETCKLAKQIYFMKTRDCALDGNQSLQCDDSSLFSMEKMATIFTLQTIGKYLTSYQVFKSHPISEVLSSRLGLHMPLLEQNYHSLPSARAARRSLLSYYNKFSGSKCRTETRESLMLEMEKMVNYLRHKERE
jgi:hypothetical protein